MVWPTEHLSDLSIFENKLEWILFMREIQQGEIDKNQVKYLSMEVCKNSLDTAVQFPKQ